MTQEMKAAAKGQPYKAKTKAKTCDVTANNIQTTNINKGKSVISAWKLLTFLPGHKTNTKDMQNVIVCSSSAI